MEGKKKDTSRKSVSASFKVGSIALAFLITGYQISLFIHSSAVAHIASVKAAPDTVFVVEESLARQIMQETSSDGQPSGGSGISGHPVIVTHKAELPEQMVSLVEKRSPHQAENFPFNPNSVSVDELQRLGFSLKQAQSIINYREKGGRFRRASDFSKSYVVSDSMFKRLEPYIVIPKIDLNRADSTGFDSLPGIGPHFASQIVLYREKLKGYSYPEQLLDIYNFDKEKYDGLKDLISVSNPEPYPLWTADEKELEKHPYIGKYAAHGIIIFRNNNPKDKLTVRELEKAGILKPDMADKLSRCVIAEP